MTYVVITSKCVCCHGIQAYDFLHGTRFDSDIGVDVGLDDKKELVGSLVDITHESFLRTYNHFCKCDKNEAPKVYFFDVDGTLTEKWGNDLKPEVANWFKNAPHTSKFALLTNQGGIALHDHLKMSGVKDYAKYPDYDQVCQRMFSIMGQIKDLANCSVFALVSVAYRTKQGGWLTPSMRGEVHSRGETHVIFYDEKIFRKPNPGLLFSAMHPYDVLPQDCLMVGDQHSDWLAAHRAGVRFEMAEGVFGE